MNYGKKKASQKQNQITSKSTMQGKRIGVRLFKAFLLCMIVVAVAGVAGVGIFAKKIIDNTPKSLPTMSNQKASLPLFMQMTVLQRLNVLYPQVPTAYTNPLTRSPRICSMLLLPLRTSVFMTTTESTCRVLPVRR